MSPPSLMPPGLPTTYSTKAKSPSRASKPFIVHPFPIYLTFSHPRLWAATRNLTIPGKNNTQPLHSHLQLSCLVNHQFTKAFDSWPLLLPDAPGWAPQKLPGALGLAALQSPLVGHPSLLLSLTIKVHTPVFSPLHPSAHPTPLLSGLTGTPNSSQPNLRSY